MAGLRRHWFLLGLALAVGLGLSYPAAGEAIRGLVPFLVAAVMAIAGFTTEARNLLRQVRRPLGILIPFATVYLAAPLAGLFWASLLAPVSAAPEFREAVMVLAAQAGTISTAIAFTMLAGGNRELALINTLATNLSAAFMTPLVLRATLGRGVAFDPDRMVASLAGTVLLPVGVGMLARSGLGRWSGYQPGRATLLGARVAAQSIILSFVVVGFSRAAPELSEHPDMVLRFLAVALALHLTLVALTWGLCRLARLDPPDRPAVVFTGSQKTLPNGIYIAETFFPTNHYAALPLVLYHLLQLVLDALLAPRLAASGAGPADHRGTDSGGGGGGR